MVRQALAMIIHDVAPSFSERSMGNIRMLRSVATRQHQRLSAVASFKQLFWMHILGLCNLFAIGRKPLSEPGSWKFGSPKSDNRLRTYR